MDLKHYNNHDDDGDVYVGDDGDLGDDDGDDAKNGATCINIKGKQSGVLSCYVLKVVLNLAHGVVSCVIFIVFLINITESLKLSESETLVFFDL